MLTVNKRQTKGATRWQINAEKQQSPPIKECFEAMCLLNRFGCDNAGANM